MYTDLQAVASPLGHSTARAVLPAGTGRDSLRADDGIRTRDPHLGKVMLYQLSHVRAPPPPEPGAGATRNHSRADRRSPNISAQRTRRRHTQDQFGHGYPDRVTLTSPTSGPPARRVAQRRAPRPIPTRRSSRSPTTAWSSATACSRRSRPRPAGAFAVQRHLDRLSRSAAAMGLPAPDHELVREGIAAVLEGCARPGQGAGDLHRRRGTARLAAPRTGRPP